MFNDLLYLGWAHSNFFPQLQNVKRHEVIDRTILAYPVVVSIIVW